MTNKEACVWGATIVGAATGKRMRGLTSSMAAAPNRTLARTEEGALVVHPGRVLAHTAQVFEYQDAIMICHATATTRAYNSGLWHSGNSHWQGEGPGDAGALLGT
jgi:hypothetical protein